MARFVLIPGAGGVARYWHRVRAELEARTHDATAVDLPGDNESLGLPDYADTVVAAIEDDPDVTVVAQSLGGFTAPLACTRVPVRSLVLVNAMIPLPGETPGDWWATTGAEEARIAAANAGGYPEEFDVEHHFFHDLAVDERSDLQDHYRPEADIVFGQRCEIDHWPDVPTRVLTATDDRFFPVDFQRRIARDRLGAEAELVPGGHLVALSHPHELVERLIDDVAT